MMNWEIGSINLIYFFSPQSTLCVFLSGSYRLLIRDENNFSSAYIRRQVSNGMKRGKKWDCIRLWDREYAYGVEEEMPMHDSSDLWRKRRRSPVSLRKVLKAFSVGIFSHLRGRGHSFQMGEKLSSETWYFQFFTMIVGVITSNWWGEKLLRCPQLQKLRSHFRLHTENTCIFSINNSIFCSHLNCCSVARCYLCTFWIVTFHPLAAYRRCECNAVNKKRVICATRSKKMKWFMFFGQHRRRHILRNRFAQYYIA